MKISEVKEEDAKAEFTWLRGLGLRSTFFNNVSPEQDEGRWSPRRQQRLWPTLILKCFSAQGKGNLP